MSLTFAVGTNQNNYTMRKYFLFTALVALLLRRTPHVHVQKFEGLAGTLAMGWNNWNKFAYTIDWQKFNFTDEEVSKLSTNFDTKVYSIRNLWTKDAKKAVEGNTKKLKQVTIPGHDVVLYRLSELVSKKK